MPKKIQFEWELPDALVEALTPETTGVAETIKAAAVLDWVCTHKLSLRRGAKLLQMPYRAFLDLDVMVVALAIEQHTTLLMDDNAVRLLAIAHGVPVIGSMGILIRARLDVVVAALKPLLDQLIAAGFHLDPQGHVYSEALRRVGEK